MTYTLLPRLAPGRASELRSKIISARVHPVFDVSLLESEISAANAFPSSGGARISQQALLALREQCLDSLPDPLDGAKIDLRLGRIFHEMSEGSTGEYGIAAVWDFLTLVLLPDVATKRFKIDSKDIVSRLTGGHRRHVFQRLWRRWNLLGPQAIESKTFTEDEYQALLERTITSEMKGLALGVFEEVHRATTDGMFARREFTRPFMKQLMQTTGLVDISEDDRAHLSVLLDYVSDTTRKLLAKQ